MARPCVLALAAAVIAGHPASAADNGSGGVSLRSPFPAESTAPAGDPDYLIGPGDNLRISVFGVPDLSRQVTVAPDGYISFPLAKEIQASGKTAAMVEGEIAQNLAASLIEPHVTVDVTAAAGSSSRSVRIIGAAITPKSIPYRAGMRVLDALLAVGGLSRTADGNRAVLVRGDAFSTRIPLRLDDLLENQDTSADVPVKPGDVIIIPEGFFAGNWERRLSLTVSQAFTDNVNLAPNGDEKAALVTSLTPKLAIAGSGARFSGALSAAVTGGYVSLADTGFNVVPDILGSSKAELTRDRVYVDAAAAVNKQALNAATETSSVAAITNNRTLVQTYQVSPYLVSRIKDVAYVETRYNVAGTVTGDGSNQSASTSTAAGSETLSDSVTNGLQVRLARPPEKPSRLDWQAIGYGRQTMRFGTSDVLEGGGSVAPQVAISRTLSLLANTGYSFLDVGDVRLSGPEGAAGFHYEPSPALSVRALGGWRLEHPEVDVVLRYDPEPTSRVSASYTDSVGVGQTMLINTLGRLTYDPETRQFVDDRTASAYSSANTGYNLENGLTRTQQAGIGVAHSHSVDTLSFRTYYTKQDLVEGGGSSNGQSGGLANSQSSWGVTAGWRRSLSTRTTAETALGFAYTAEDSEASAADAGDAGTLKDLRFQIGLITEITETMSGFITYYYQRRFADQSSDAFTENAVVVGLTRRF